MKKFLLTVATLSTLAIGGIAVAGPGGHGPGHGPERAVLGIIKNLDLSDEQKTALKTIREDAREDHEAVRGEREELFEIIRSQLLQESPDASVLHAMVDAREAARTERAHQMMDTMLDIQAVLTAAQRQQVADELEVLRQERPKRFESRHRE